MADFKYEIIEELGVLSESAKGWTKELNRISWMLFRTLNDASFFTLNCAVSV